MNHTLALKHSLRLHLDKPGIRALGVAESFRKGRPRSLLAGVVMRSDFVVDGVALGETSVGGDDATAAIASLLGRLKRNDINLILVSGAILSLYNFVDVDALCKKTRLPVICLTYKETSGIEASIRRHFPRNPGAKLEAYMKLGARTRVKLRTGQSVYVRSSGVDLVAVGRVLDSFTLQGSVPEPVRVAKLFARAAMARRP